MNFALGQQFQEFDELNPDVYDEFKRMAWVAQRKGHSCLGIHLLLNVIRWEIAMKTEDPNHDFKICTSYCPFYARKLAVERVVPPTFFEFRTSLADYYDYVSGCPEGHDWFTPWWEEATGVKREFKGLQLPQQEMQRESQ
jgi:hypothetical protein